MQLRFSEVSFFIMVNVMLRIVLFYTSLFKHTLKFLAIKSIFFACDKYVFAQLAKISTRNKVLQVLSLFATI